MPLSLSTTTNSEHIFWNKRAQQLEIDWSPLLGYPCKLYISGWSRGIDWWSVVDGEIHRPLPFADPGIDLLTPSDNPAIRQWQEGIPVSIWNTINQFSSHRFSLLKMTHNWLEANDLLQSNPLLLWLAWDHAHSNKQDIAQFRELLRQKQPVILASMGLSGTKSSARLLRRVDTTAFDAYLGGLVRKTWRQADLLPKMSHMQLLEKTTLRIFSNYPWLAGQPLAAVFHRIDCSWQRENLYRQIQDSVRMGGDAIHQQMANCNSAEAVDRIHDQLVAEINQRRHFRSIGRDDQGKILPFPEPPHSGNEHIAPILSVEALRKESEKMHHCVGVYAEDVLQGRYFVYHMDQPQPLTIGVHVRNDRIRHLDQAKGACNAPPEAEAMELIEEWLKAAISR